MFRVAFSLVCVGALFCSSVLASDWARFRGPNGTGLSADEKPTPVFWNPKENLKWKCALPGAGSSSPIVVGDRIYVTSWSGYGLNQEDVGDQDKLLRHLTCIDKKTGKIVWDKTVKPYLPEDEYRGMFAEHGYASHTPVSDGERIYVFFGKTGALAFDLEGNQLWQQSVGTESGAKGWGSSSSPILYGNLVIVPATAESEALVALEKTTGKEVWRQEAAGLNSVWGTPIVVNVDSKRDDLVIAVPGEIWGLNPDTGKLRWFCTIPDSGSFCSSAVAVDGVIYTVESGPRGGGGTAVRVGGNGDVTESHVVWVGRQSSRIGTPIVHEGRIYAFARGVANCWDTAEGKDVFRGRLQAATRGNSGGDSDQGRGGGRRGRGGGRGQDYASPVLAGGKIYFTSRGGDIHVLEAGSEFKQLATNRVTNDREDFSATPAVSDGELFVRSSKHLYCVAKLQEVSAPIKEVAVASNIAFDTPAAERDRRSRGEGRDRQRGNARRGGFDPAAMFRRRDADGDGKLSGDELVGILKENLEKFDTNKDGGLTLEEIRNGVRGDIFSRGRGGANRKERRPERSPRPVLDE